MIPLIGPIIGAISSIASSWLETRKVKAQGKIQIAQAKIDARVKKETMYGEMDLTAMSDMKFSWKDELLTIWTLAVVTGCFIPGLQVYVRDGFIFLEEATPDWFGYCFVGMYVAVFGLRTFKGWGNNA
jgi:hypothetical protein